MITWYNATVPKTENNKAYNFGFAVKNEQAFFMPEYWLNGANVKNQVFRDYFKQRNISVVKIADQYEPGDKELLKFEREYTGNRG